MQTISKIFEFAQLKQPDIVEIEGFETQKQLENRIAAIIRLYSRLSGFHGLSEQLQRPATSLEVLSWSIEEWAGIIAAVFASIMVLTVDIAPVAAEIPTPELRNALLPGRGVGKEARKEGNGMKMNRSDPRNSVPLVKAVQKLITGAVAFDETAILWRLKK